MRVTGILITGLLFMTSVAAGPLQPQGGLPDRKALRRWFRTGATTVTTDLELGPIGQIARSVSDTKVSENWYREVLGVPHLYTFGTLAFFDLNGTRLMLSQEGGARSESLLYLRVPDIGAAHATLTARGVRFTHAPHMIHRHADGTEEWMAFFEDPDARPMAIMCQRGAG